MTKSSNDEQAAALIAEFASRLLGLTGGKTIPREWKDQLLKALKPPPAASGRKTNVAKTAQAVTLLARAYREVSGTRTKAHNPAKAKDRIAKQVGYSRKTIENIFFDLKCFPSEEGLPPDKLRALVEGLSEVIAEESRKDIATEEDQAPRRADIGRPRPARTKK